MDRNQALEMELLRVKGKVSPSPDVSPGSCAGRKHHLGELERLKGCTQSARGNATEKISLASAGVAPPCDPIVDGRETATDFQLLAGLDDDDAGIKLDGGSMGNHIYFSSEDEVDSVDEPDTRMESPIQNVDEAEFSSVAMGMISALPLGSVPCPAIIDVQAEASCTSADADPRERETRESDDIIEKVPRTNLGNSEKEDLNQNNQGSEDKNLDQQSESEEEGIRNYVKQPAECGMPPMLTVLNPKYKRDIEVPKESKEKKKINAGTRTACWFEDYPAQFSDGLGCYFFAVFGADFGLLRQTFGAVLAGFAK